MALPVRLAILIATFAVATATVAVAAGPVDVEKTGATKFSLSGIGSPRGPAASGCPIRRRR
jgi:hypothetical protein